MTNLLADLRYALRTLRRSPLFAAVAIFSLALGIGANTAIFTLIDQIVLRQLPVKDPESLVMLFQQGAHNGSNMGSRMHSYPIYQDYQQKAAPLAEVLCRRLVNASLSVDNRTERVDAEMKEINRTLPKGVIAHTLYNRSGLVNATIDTVKKNLLEGALLVAIVLYLFLGNFRAAGIVAVVIPLSLLATFIGLRLRGI